MIELENLAIAEVGGCGDNIKAWIDRDGALAIEVEEPWAGDTEAGFGRSGAVRLNLEQARELSVWLQQAVEQMSKEHQ